MQSMVSGGVKGLGALFVVWLTYIDKTFTPLFWVLLALIFVDLVLNVHKGEGTQFTKLGSALVSMGIPQYLGNNGGMPHLAKYLVAMMVIAYIQIVIPQLLTKLDAVRWNKNPVQQKLDQDTIDAIVSRAVNAATARAQEVIDSAPQAAIGPQIVGAPSGDTPAVQVSTGPVDTTTTGGGGAQ